MNRVKAGIFSMTPPTPEDDDGSYLRWHLLDHMPEQFQLPGIVNATRWTADAKCVAGRIAGEGPLSDIGNVMNYFVGDPVQPTLDDFMELGLRLAELGRFPEVRPSLQLRMLGLLRWAASPQALISAEVVPWRAHRGVLLIVEEPTGDLPADWLQWIHSEHHPELLSVPGTAGAWLYGSTNFWNLHPRADGPAQYVTVVYLDDDPVAVTKALTTVIEKRWASGAVRPLFAGPLRSMIQWNAWP